MAGVLSSLTTVPISPVETAAPTHADARRNALPKARTTGFIAGDENRLVAAVMSQLASAAMKGDFGETDLPSPLVLTGPSGSGKTHLARGVAELFRACWGEEHVRYLTASEFNRQFASAVDRNRVSTFRKSLRKLRMLVIDDVDRLSLTEARRSELRHTLDALEESGAFVLLASPGPLASATEFDRPLLSRLAAGLVLTISPPGVEARRELLRQAAESMNCQFDADALDALVAGLPTEPPVLLRAVAELNRYDSITRIDAAAASALLQAARGEHSPPLRDILRVAARYYKMPLRTLTSASRQRGVVMARGVAIYLARELTPLSYEQIGQMLGGRDHTTIMHAHKTVTKALATDRALAAAIDDLMRLLDG